MSSTNNDQSSNAAGQASGTASGAQPLPPVDSGTGAKIRVLDPLAERFQESYLIHNMELSTLKNNIGENTATDEKLTSVNSEDGDQRLIGLQQQQQKDYIEPGNNEEDPDSHPLKNLLGSNSVKNPPSTEESKQVTAKPKISEDPSQD